MKTLKIDNTTYEIEKLNSAHLKGREWLAREQSDHGFFIRCASYRVALRKTKSYAGKLRKANNFINCHERFLKDGF